jgi:hypothetical protein
MSRPLALSSLALFLALGAAGGVRAEDWRVCVANMGNSEPGQERIIWTVSQPFEVSGIPDWRGQFEAAKAERRAVAAQRGLEAPDDSFLCTEASPDLAGALAQRENMKENFRVRLEGFNLIGVPFSWEEWSWVPTGSATPDAKDSTAVASSADDEGGSANTQADDGSAERQRAAEVKRLQELKDERDRLAAETAKLEKQLADAKRERDRLASEALKQKNESASTDTDANRCVTSPELRQNDTFQGNTAAYVTNGCGTPVDVRICLMKENGVWNCGMTYGLAPQKSWSWSSMKATGQTFMDARVSGSTRQMAAP